MCESCASVCILLLSGVLIVSCGTCPRQQVLNDNYLYAFLWNSYTERAGGQLPYRTVVLFVRRRMVVNE